MNPSDLKPAASGPKVTVVTVVLNSRLLMEATILSVLGQDYDNLEYVVVDGGSTDGTLDIIERYRSRINRLVVEKDRGIYDAMNKSARLATGDYIIFMNSGDEFFSVTSVSELCASAKNGEELVYGGWIVRYPWGLERSGRPAARKDFWKGMFVQHQSVMVSTHYMLEHPFDLTLGLGADYAFLLALANSGAPIRECPAIVSRVSSGGASDSNRGGVLKSHWQQARRFYPGLRTDLHFISVIVRERLAVAVKRWLPSGFVRRIIAAKS